MIRRLVVAVALVLGVVAGGAAPAEAGKKTRYYCQVDPSVPAVYSLRTYRGACLAHIKKSGFPGVSLTRFDRCTVEDDCAFGLDQVNVTAARVVLKTGEIQEFDFIAITWTVRR